MSEAAKRIVIIAVGIVVGVWLISHLFTVNATVKIGTVPTETR